MVNNKEAITTSVSHVIDRTTLPHHKPGQSFTTLSATCWSKVSQIRAAQWDGNENVLTCFPSDLRRHQTLCSCQVAVVPQRLAESRNKGPLHA